MEKEEKELIDHLAEQLRAHEVPYKEGAWEKFAQLEKAGGNRMKKGRIRQLLSPWAAAAAAVVLILLAGRYYMNRQAASSGPVTQEVTHTALNTPNNQQAAPGAAPARSPGSPAGSMAKSDDIKNDADHQESTITSGPAESDKAKDADRPYRPLARHAITPAGSPDFMNPAGLLSGIERLRPGVKTAPPAPPLEQAGQTDQRQLPGGTTSTNEAIAQSELPAATVQPADKNSGQAVGQNRPDAPPANTTATAFDDHGYFDPDAPGQTGRKWNMGVMVAPAVGNDNKVNLGYGVSVGYQLSNRLSLNSGLSYTEMSGSRDVAPQMAVSSGGRTLSAIDANVSGLNVPLELRYHVSEKIYVGAGVSALAVLSNKQERQYAINQLQFSDVLANSGNLLKPDQIAAFTSDIKTKEAIPTDQVGSKDFAGFLNFSFGFKQKLNKSKSLSVEPFLSVPMSNNLSKQNVHLTDGGIRLKLGF